MSRVLLFTHEPVLAKGFSFVLSAVPDFDFVAVCDARQVFDAVALHKPDLLLVDVSECVDHSLLNEIRKRADRCRIVLWAHSIAPELAYQLMHLGVRGILPRTMAPEALVNCLQRIREGGLWFEEPLLSDVQNGGTIKLTPRESQLVRLVAQGLRNKEIAGELGLSENSVKVYVSKLFHKIGVSDRYALAVYGLRNLVDSPAATDREHPGEDRRAAQITLLRPRAPERATTARANLKAIAAARTVAN